MPGGVLRKLPQGSHLRKQITLGETLKSGTRVRVARGLSREDRFFGKVWILCLSRQTKENGTAVCTVLFYQARDAEKEDVPVRTLGSVWTVSLGHHDAESGLALCV